MEKLEITITAISKYNEFLDFHACHPDSVELLFSRVFDERLKNHFLARYKDKGADAYAFIYTFSSMDENNKEKTVIGIIEGKYR